jgi:tripartite-type tricarboxylate transporter receptor subunit TctC
VAQVNEAMARVVNLADLKERMGSQGVVMKSSSPEVFRKLVASDIAGMSRIVKAAGIKVD